MRTKIKFVTIVITMVFLVIGFSGCNDIIPSNTISIEEIKSHPNKYMGKEVSIEGKLGGKFNIYRLLYTGSLYSEPIDYNDIYFKTPDNLSISLYIDGTYIVTGILKIGDITVVFTDRYYLDDVSIKSV